MTNASKPASPSGAELLDAFSAIAAKSRKLVTEYFERAKTDDGYTVLDPVVVAKTMQESLVTLMANPRALAEIQFAYWRDQTELWARTMQRTLFGSEIAPVAEPARDDKRFKSDLWAQNFVFDYMKQAYLLASRHVQTAVAGLDGFDEHSKKKAVFYTRQFLDAMSPANFALTNPEVLKATVETGGQNLIKGLENMLADLERGKGRLALKMTDLDAFRLGENIAATAGKVVFQNDLIQLIQYNPATDTVHRRPLLVVPPWINKFYILDLKPQSSFIKWAVDQGHTVFVISWINPDERLAHKSFDNYLFEGPLAALDAIRDATGEAEVNALGYCIGGTLLGSALAYMAANADARIKSATFFTSLLDFSDVGEISVFVDEEQLALLEAHMNRKGYLEGHHMANAFNLLRENDLIWSFVIGNYLLGRDPLPFDLLYWNSDSTRMPAAMHGFYLRNMYQHNLLREPGGITLAGIGIDLRLIETPAFFLSTREDHIAPWKTAYAGTQLLSGPVEFVLGGSGHIAGVINPPAAKKYGYWVNDVVPATPDEWLGCARQVEGSWWPHWAQWVAQFAGGPVSARRPGEGALKAIEDAPGSYVRVRAG